LLAFGRESEAVKKLVFGENFGILAGGEETDRALFAVGNIL
jgi:hypothetical protein